MKKTIGECYEELRQIIDGGAESFTHDDAVAYLEDRFAQTENRYIQIDEWNGLTDKQKLILIRHAPDWTVLQLIEQVEDMLKGNNK